MGEWVFVTDGAWRKALAVVRSLGRHGIAVTVGEASRWPTAAFSRYCSRRLRYPSPALAPQAFRRTLAAELATRPYRVLLPLEDTTLRALAAPGAELPKEVRIPIPPPEILALALDKAATLSRARQAGVPTPTTAIPARPEEAPRLAAEVGYPVFLKPRDAWGSQGATLVERPADFPAAYARVHASFPLPMIQAYVPPGGEAFGVSCLLTAGGAVRATFVHKRLREFPLRGGPSTLRVSVRRDDLVELALRLLRALGWSYFAMVEFRTDPRDGRPYLMEVNPRFVGSLALAVQSGVDFPWLTYLLATTGDCPEVRDYRVGQVCRWLLPGDILHFVANPRRFRLEPSFFQFRAPGLGYDILSRDDPWPVAGALVAMVRAGVSPRMWRYAFRRDKRLRG